MQKIYEERTSIKNRVEAEKEDFWNMFRSVFVKEDEELTTLFIILDSSYSYSHLHQISFFIESHYEWQNVNEGVTGMGPYAFVL